MSPSLSGPPTPQEAAASTPTTPTVSHTCDPARFPRGGDPSRRLRLQEVRRRRRWSRELDEQLVVDPAPVVELVLIDYEPFSWTVAQREAAGRWAA